MIRYIYSFVGQHEKYFLFQNVAVGAANLTLRDYLNITAQIISIVTMVLSAAIMADNHFKIFTKKSTKEKSEENKVGSDDESNER